RAEARLAPGPGRRPGDGSALARQRDTIGRSTSIARRDSNAPTSAATSSGVGAPRTMRRNVASVTFVQISPAERVGKRCRAVSIRGHKRRILVGGERESMAKRGATNEKLPRGRGAVRGCCARNGADRSGPRRGSAVAAVVCVHL